jgi:hypothetical protein
VIILALGFVYLPFIRSKDTMLKAFLTLIPVFVTPLFTLYVVGVLTRAHARSGVIGMCFGAAYGLVALYDREISDRAGLAPWFTGRWEALAWSMVFTGAAMAVATMVLGRCPDRRLVQGPADGWLASSREQVEALRERPEDVAIPRWANPVWFAVLLMVCAVSLVFGVFW